MSARGNLTDLLRWSAARKEPNFAQRNDCFKGLKCMTPHILPLDTRLSDLDGIEMLRQIKAKAPQARVLTQTSSEAVTPEGGAIWPLAT